MQFARIDRIDGDDQAESIAVLDCWHAQPVGRPPAGDNGEAGRKLTQLECARCDRAELPDGLVVVRTAGPFDEDEVPVGLRRAHRVADGVWGRLRVLEGSVGFRMEGVSPVLDRQVAAGEEQPIPPRAAHQLKLTGPVQLCVDFLRPR